MRRSADLENWVLGLTILASGAMLYQTFFYPPVAAQFPRLVSAFVFALSAYLLAGRLRGQASSPRAKREGGLAWWAFALGLFGYFALVLVAGFLLATLLFLAAIPVWVGRTRWVTVTVYSLVTTALLGAAMRWVLQVPIPSGLLFR